MGLAVAGRGEDLPLGHLIKTPDRLREVALPVAALLGQTEEVPLLRVPLLRQPLVQEVRPRAGHWVLLLRVAQNDVVDVGALADLLVDFVLRAFLVVRVLVVLLGGALPAESVLLARPGVHGV